ncbi:MAG: vWA domain-containing protein [Polyangiales bacterium]
MNRTLIASACVAVFALGCESDVPEAGTARSQDLPSICGEEGAPTSCGDTCRGDSGCGVGTFCTNGVCIAVCTSAGGHCGVGAECTPNGRCVPTFGDGGMMTPDGSVCGQLEVATARVIPNIMLIVDRSGSMLRDFEGDCPYNGNGCPNFGTPNPDFDEARWDSVEDALVGTNGLVRRLDSIARFGLALYWKPGEDSPSLSDGEICASTDGVAIVQSLDNASSIAARFAANDPGGYTPTAEAIETVTESLIATPPPEGPTVYLLATDGLPNGCDEDGENVDRDNSVNAVQRAFGLGIETFVLGVNFDDEHLQDLANAGRGAASGATLWTADSVSELQAALEQIVVQNIPCTVKLTDGTIDTLKACDGQVRLNGEALDCNDQERGWRPVDGRTIEVTGSACADWRAGDADLEAVFPCYVVVQ